MSSYRGSTHNFASALNRNHGISDTMDSIGSIAGVFKRKQYSGFCQSFSCTLSASTTDMDGKKTTPKWIRKNVSSERVFCPDCNSSLFWKENK
jgi:hypothetical protein